MANTFNSGRILLNKMELFNYLTTCQMEQMTHLSLLHANQAVVPAAAPAPGFEHLMCHPRIKLLDQKLHTAKKPVVEPKKSFLDDLYGFGGDDVEALFNGISDSPVFSDNQGKRKDIDQLPDPTVLYNLLDAASNSTPWLPDTMALVTKELLESMNSSESPSLPAETEKQIVKQETPVTTQKPIKRRKRGPRPLVKYRGDGPIQLWQFLLELVTSPECTKLIKWTQEEDYEFKILQPSTVAKMWGKKKNKPTMNYEKLSRGIRYYYGNSVIEKVHGKRYVYRFLCDIPKILGYDPMKIKCEEFVEDSVHGEAIMSPEVEDLVVASSVEDCLFAGSLDFSVLY
ncbi:protein C-ets-2-like isoform X2 [Orbicella faveolata]|uniref:protein C-ets-2-like isoform X2 n=1 Tax=Orbicella faveolata TaxID=48498 RepID=UPI0009E29B1F|nr:protein C-ets-2-like isoform X2 [Orbicella faveolata]